MNEEELQNEINRSMCDRDCGAISRIELGPGSDVTDLSLAADVRVFTAGSEFRGFGVRAKEFIDMVFAGAWKDGHPRPDVADICTTGGPLLIVERITGDSVVRGVLRYLELEHP
ncbi:MAG TPA: hypothetical protein VM243_00595 [Phycisphaerae bacterium]|nr:hypothetical protein [Phycisphaerae bacterium]